MVSRIKQLLDWQQLSPTQFADRIGVGRPVVSHILSERNKPSLDVVRQIRAAFPMVSLDWLLDGIGTMLLPEPVAASAVAPAPAQAPVAPPEAPAAPAAGLPTVQPQPELANSVVSAPMPFTASVAAPVAAPAPPAPVPNNYPLPQPSPRPAIPRFRLGVATASASTPVANAEAASPIVVEPMSASAVAAGSPAPAGQIAAAPAAFPVAAGPIAAAAPAHQPVVPVAEPAPPVAEAPLVPAPVDAVSAVADKASAPGLPTLADVFGESGKAIRRIVIFYRDGSFADYQPEA